MAGFLGTEPARNIFDSLTLAVRNGGSVWSEGDNTKPNDDFWVAFARSMAPLTVPASEFISGLLRVEDGKPAKVLDIAAGHGMYGITVARENPKAEIVALDLPAGVEGGEGDGREIWGGGRYNGGGGRAL